MSSFVDITASKSLSSSGVERGKLWDLEKALELGGCSWIRRGTLELGDALGFGRGKPLDWDGKL